MTSLTKLVFLVDEEGARTEQSSESIQKSDADIDSKLFHERINVEYDSKFEFSDQNLNESEIEQFKTLEFVNSAMKDNEIEETVKSIVKPVPEVKSKSEVNHLPKIERKSAKENIVMSNPEVVAQVPVPVAKLVSSPIPSAKVQGKVLDKSVTEEKTTKPEKKDTLVKPDTNSVSKPVDKKKQSVPTVPVISPVVPVKPSGHKSGRKRSQEQQALDKPDVDFVSKAELEVKPEKSQSAPAVSAQTATAQTAAPVPVQKSAWGQKSETLNFASMLRRNVPNVQSSTMTTSAQEKPSSELIKAEDQVNIDPMARKISEILHEKDESPKDGQYFFMLKLLSVVRITIETE